MEKKDPAAKVTPEQQFLNSSLLPANFLAGVTKSPIALLQTLRSLTATLRSSALTRSGPGEGQYTADGNNEEGPTGKLRRVAMVWKYFASLVVAGLGMYIYLSAVSHGLFTSSLSEGNLSANFQGSDPAEHKGLLCINCCPKLPVVKYPDPEHFSTHYPRPKNYSRDECLCTPVHNFVILSMQRSGSGWFETLLNHHPNISSHGEIFTVRPRRQNFSAVQATLESIYNLDWVSSAAKDTCTVAVGLKWMLNQGAMEYHREVEAFFRQKQVSIIMLLRRNLLKRLISILANAYDRKMKLLNGTHKSHVHSEYEAKKLAEFKPELNTEHLIGNLQRVQDIANDALRVFNATRMHVVYYEDLVRDGKNLEHVQTFLGVPVRNLRSKQVKIHTKALSEQVKNWADIQKLLNGTEFEKFLRDDDNL